MTEVLKIGDRLVAAIERLDGVLNCSRGGS
jgi:hypothetical protein